MKKDLFGTQPDRSFFAVWERQRKEMKNAKCWGEKLAFFALFLKTGEI